MIIEASYRSKASKLVKTDKTIKQNRFCNGLVSSVQECRGTRMSKIKKIPAFLQRRKISSLRTELQVKEKEKI